MRDNVTLESDGINHISEKGIVTPDGVEHEHDVIVLAIGFEMNEFFFPMKYIGRNGVEIHEAWKKDGPRSYLGVAHLSQPNFFSTLGPNHAPRAGGLYS